MAEKVRKLVDRVDIMKDIDKVITPLYFPKESLDKNRTSIYAWLTEAQAKSIEDTITLEQRRAADYCPELSNSEIHVNQTAKLRGVGVSRAIPSRCFALLCVLKSDILAKGVSIRHGEEIQFTIDRRSTIIYGGINFSLEDDILIRAVRRGTKYLYAANYTGEHSTYESYIQMYEHTNTQGEELVAMICQIYQVKYNITDHHIIDLIEFTYDGLLFDYANKLASFEVYHKLSNGANFKKVPMVHYLTENSRDSLYYNDDESGILRILNNENLGITENSIIRVEIKETLGTEGNITINRSDNVSFSMYHDAAYNYSGVHVFITMLSDTKGALDGDSIEDTKKRLIDAKVRRNNITTEHDIITYINDLDANLQLVKKENDTKEHHYYLYTLMRFDDENNSRQLAPTTTKRLNLTGIRTIQNLGDFDTFDKTVDRKIIRAYNKFKLHIRTGEPDMDFVTKCRIDEDEEDAYYLTCPFMMVINDLNIISYYFTSVDEEINLSMKAANNLFPYQMICRYVHIFRDAHSPVDNDIYRFTVKGMLNTENDSILVDEETGELIDQDGVICYIFFTHNDSPVAYLPMNISSYDPDTREFIFTGTMRTTDYITEMEKLEVDKGLYKIGTDTVYHSVLDFKDATFQVSFMFKEADPQGVYPKDDGVYHLLPTSRTEEYILMNSYYNNPGNLFNLILEFSKFSRSPTQVISVGDTIFDYSVGAVPFFEFNFGIANTAKLFPTFKNMTIVYGSLLKLTTGFDLSLKFIATYGNSKYIHVVGGRVAESYEVDAPLNDLNPTIYFKVYGLGAPVEEVRQFIYEYLRDNYIAGSRVFMSNICTAIEDKFPEVESIKYMGVNHFDASFQQFVYKMPQFVNEDIVTRYVPEQLNVTDIIVELDENV